MCVDVEPQSLAVDVPCHQCEQFRREIHALEQLVDRYQEELQHCRTGIRENVDMEYFDPCLIIEEDELLEYQRLYPFVWPPDRCSADPPAICRPSGEEASFQSVKLPSEEWQWLENWRYEITANTDLSGWTYAASWSDLQIPGSSEGARDLSAHVRRRRWKRRRTYVGCKYLPKSRRIQLNHQSYTATVQSENELLRKALARERERIVELGDILKRYEKQMAGWQHSASRARLERLHQQGSSSSTASYNIGSSANALHQSEELLGELRSVQDYTCNDAIIEETLDVQRRRSQMVEACQRELQNAFEELNGLVSTPSRSSSFDAGSRVSSPRPPPHKYLFTTRNTTG